MFEEVSGLMGGSMVLSLLMLLFGSIPVILVFVTKTWSKGGTKTRLLALGIYSLLMGGLFGLAVTVMGLSIILGVMAFIGGAIYLFITGLISMILAEFIALPVTKWALKRYKLK